MIQVSKTEDQRSKTKEKIIVALDVPTAEGARKVISELDGEVGAFKIGLQLFTSAGASFVREVVSGGKRIFLDVKFHDIPNTVAKAAVEAARLGVWMFNVHAFGGGEMMRKAVEEMRETCEKENLRQPKIIGVTVLTSSDEETLKEVGIEEKTGGQVLRLARLAAKCELDGVVASPLETVMIRENIKKEGFLIVTPGVRPNKSGIRNLESGTKDDQKRVMTPKAAVRAGSDYLVIGRPVLQADDKAQAVRQILEEIETE